MTGVPHFRYTGIRTSERPWRLRIPFHYGVVTLHDAVELHLSCTIDIEGYGEQRGYSAELAAPKWFNKDPALTPDQTVDRLRGAVRRIAGIAGVPSEHRAGFATTFAEIDDAASDMVADETSLLNGLEISFAVALLERATIDALCRACQLSFPAFAAMNGLGTGNKGPDSEGFSTADWLVALRPAATLAVRHTVGLSDPLFRHDTATPFVGGRPVALADVIGIDGVRNFKIKFSGGEGEIRRLRKLSTLLSEACPDFTATLDANEAFGDAGTFAAVLQVLAKDKALAPLWSRIRYIEQPFDRSIALTLDVRHLAVTKPLLIDESDDGDTAFEVALDCGYQGVSLKTCKGIRRAVANAATAAREVARGRFAFITAEDLCVQPGVALQHNIALAATLGLPDAERNGHHFGPGPAALPPSELASFVAAHGDVYETSALRIRHGRMETGSTLTAAGFGTAVVPELNWTDA